MKNELVKLDLNQYGLQENKAKELEKLYSPMIKMLYEMEEAFNDIVIQEITPELIPVAKRFKIDVAKIRIAAEKVKTKGKAEYLRAGNAVQGAYNTLKYAVVSKEEKMDSIINHFETLEKERIEKLQLDRAEKLSKYVEDAFERDLSNMEYDVWNIFYTTKKQAYNDKIEAEKKAKKDSIAKEKAEKTERIRIVKENELLKKEAIERDRLEKVESDKRAKDEKERLAKAESERKERERLEAIEREKHEAELQKEREEKERIKKELESKAEAERKEREIEEERIQTELNKGDKAKVIDLINDFKILKTKYNFKSKKYQKMYISVNELIDKVIDFINQY